MKESDAEQESLRGDRGGQMIAENIPLQWLISSLTGPPCARSHRPDQALQLTLDFAPESSGDAEGTRGNDHDRARREAVRELTPAP